MRLGLSLGAWLAVRTGLATKPEDLRSQQLVGAGFLCGIGFTMAFFVAGVAFDDPQILALAKLSTLVASLLSAIVGWVTLQATYRRLVSAPIQSPAIVGESSS